MLTLISFLVSLQLLHKASAAPLRSSTGALVKRDGDQQPQWIDMNQQLQGTMPFVQFELSKTKDDGQVVIDLDGCGTVGYQGVQNVYAVRKSAYQCSTFRLTAQLHESPNRYSVGVADTTSPYGLAAQEGKDVTLIKTDPIFYADQRFQLLCEKPGDADKDAYFGMNCLLNADGSSADDGAKDDERCIIVLGYAEDTKKDAYKLGFGKCNRVVGNTWNVKNKAKCFSPESHIHDLKVGFHAPDPPQGC